MIEKSIDILKYIGFKLGSAHGFGGEFCRAREFWLSFFQKVEDQIRICMRNQGSKLTKVELQGTK